MGLLAAGLCSPFVGKMIDRYGGHVVMPSAFSPALPAWSPRPTPSNPVAYFAVWVLLGAAMAAALYDPAFATLGAHFRDERAPSHHATHFHRRLCIDRELAAHASPDRKDRLARHLSGLCGTARFRRRAALAFALPREHAAPRSSRSRRPRAGTAEAPAGEGLPFVARRRAFALYVFVPSALSAHMLAIFARCGIDAATVVSIGALFGPAQVAARLLEFIFARKQHPLTIARGAVGS